MHPTGGSRRVLRQFAWLEVGSVKIALSQLAHQRVTLTVGLPMQKDFRETIERSLAKCGRSIEA